MRSTISFPKITISCTKIFVGNYLHILTQYIFGGISACHSISTRIIIFWEIGIFMSHDHNNNDKTCIWCCLKYFELGTDRGIRFLLMSLKCLSDCTITNLQYYVLWLHSVRPTREMISKYILYIWFSHFTLTETYQCWNYSLSLYFNKNRFSMRSVLTHWLAIETISKLLDCGRKVLNDVHIDTYHCKPELTSWRWINIIMFNTRYLSQLIRNVRTRRRIDISSNIARPLNFYTQWERSLK